MRQPPDCCTQPWIAGRTPLEVAAFWPDQRPLVMLHSGRSHRRWARWSILASPVATYQFGGKSSWLSSSALPPRLAAVKFTNDPLVDLDAILQATHHDQDGPFEHPIPFHGGWIGYFSYDLGRIIEPRAQWGPAASNSVECAWQLIELAHCPNALIFDHVTQTWTILGQPLKWLALDRDSNPKSHGFSLGPLSPTIDRDQYMSIVARTIEYIAAGDIFQANIAQDFTASFSGSTRAFALAAFEEAQPWYGAYLELGPVAHAALSTQHSALLSLSPELFLQFDPHTRRIVARPIKGTRPASVAPRELLESAKDAAELHMIIDLMRNDLGRVCEFGSIAVPRARTIESHPTVHHGVGEVVGRVRRGVSLGDLLRATFPGGSVTGAPKIRAMQIIDELERRPRGPYCGAIGFVSDCGGACLNIAIRTAMLTGTRPERSDSDSIDGTLHYSAGAGIVADSDPAAEHRETFDKAAIIRTMSRPPTPPPARNLAVSAR